MKCFLRSIPLATSLVPALITSHLGCGSRLSTGCSVSLLSRHWLLPSLTPDGLPLCVTFINEFLFKHFCCFFIDWNRSLKFGVWFSSHHALPTLTISFAHSQSQNLFLIVWSSLPHPVTGSCYGTQAGFKFTAILLPQPAECWDSRVPSHAAVLTLLFCPAHPAPDQLHSYAQPPAPSRQTFPFSVFSTPHHLTAPNSRLFSYITLPQIILAWSWIYCLWHCRIISYVLKCAMLYFVVVNLLLIPHEFFFLV